MSSTNGSAPPAKAPKEAKDGAGFSVVNEFGAVYVQKVLTHNGERLKITSPRLGYEIHLDAIQLESISWQEPEFFASLLITPFGPKNEVE